MSDKPPKDCTMAERRAMYSKMRCAPATDREARQLERVLWLFREMPRIKPKTILDIGCESGFITRWMVDEPYVKSLIGVDPCEFSIEHAKNLVKRRSNPNKASYEVKGWEDSVSVQVSKDTMSLTFDAVVCFEVIEHFLPEEGRQLIKKIHNTLAPGGTAFLCTPSSEGRYGRNNPDPWHLTIYDRDGLNKLIKDTVGVVPVVPVSENTDPDFVMIKWTKS